MVKIRGVREVAQRLRDLGGAEAKAEIGKALFAAGNLIQTEAQISLTRGAVSGKFHTPSAPGEPPNQDTGVLGNNIETIQDRPLKVTVASNAPYSAELEFGTSKMAARPFMRPAAAKHKGDAAKLVRDAMNRVIRKGAKRR